MITANYNYKLQLPQHCYYIVHEYHSQFLTIQPSMFEAAGSVTMYVELGYCIIAPLMSIPWPIQPV